MAYRIPPSPWQLRLLSVASIRYDRAVNREQQAGMSMDCTAHQSLDSAGEPMPSASSRAASSSTASPADQQANEKKDVWERGFKDSLATRRPLEAVKLCSLQPAKTQTQLLLQCHEKCPCTRMEKKGKERTRVGREKELKYADSGRQARVYRDQRVGRREVPPSR